MISQILKFALEILVVAFIAYYVAQKMEKAIEMKDACVIGIGAACVITVIEKCFNKREFFDDYEDEEDYETDSEDEEEYEKVDNTNDQDPMLKEQKVIEGFEDAEEVVVKVNAQGKVIESFKDVVQQAKKTKAVSTEQVRGKLSMQEQKIVDAVQTEQVKKEIKKYNKGGPRNNPDYGYSFLPPAEWNLPLPDMKKCIPQKVCPPCPLLGIDNGAYLNVTGAKKLPPRPVKKKN